MKQICHNVKENLIQFILFNENSKIIFFFPSQLEKKTQKKLFSNSKPEEGHDPYQYVIALNKRFIYLFIYF